MWGMRFSPSLPAASANLSRLLSAAACGAKLSALGFVAAPLGVLMLVTSWSAGSGGSGGSGGSRRLPLMVMTAAAVALAWLTPWLLRNWVHAGNPVFPFATFAGTGHWTPEQADTWRQGHLYNGGVSARLGELWNQYFRYGIGPAPDPTEPWRPQWSLLPWLAPVRAWVTMKRSALSS